MQVQNLSIVSCLKVKAVFRS